MNIDIERLKEAQTKEIKRQKWINRGTVLVGLVLFLIFGYFFSLQSENMETWKLIVGLVAGMFFILIVLLLVVVFLINWSSRKFIKHLDAIVNDNQNTNGQVFYDALINMRPQPETFDEHVYWYFNISTALFRKGELRESLKIVMAISDILNPKHPMLPLYQDQERHLRMQLKNK